MVLEKTILNAYLHFKLMHSIYIYLVTIYFICLTYLLYIYSIYLFHITCLNLPSQQTIIYRPTIRYLHRTFTSMFDQRFQIQKFELSIYSLQSVHTKQQRQFELTLPLYLYLYQLDSCWGREILEFFCYLSILFIYLSIYLYISIYLSIYISIQVNEWLVERGMRV